MYNKHRAPSWNRHSRHSAFTLIEILIVVVIVGITITFALLAFGDFGQSRRVKAQAERIAMLIPLAEQQAILQPSVYGIRFQPHSYQFYRYLTASNHQRGHWEKISNDKLFKPYQLSQRISLSLKATLTATPQPQIVITNTGDITPFELAISSTGHKPLYRISVKSNGNVNLTKVSHDE